VLRKFLPLGRAGEDTQRVEAYAYKSHHWVKGKNIRLYTICKMHGESCTSSTQACSSDHSQSFSSAWARRACKAAPSGMLSIAPFDSTAIAAAQTAERRISEMSSFEAGSLPLASRGPLNLSRHRQLPSCRELDSV